MQLQADNGKIKIILQNPIEAIKHRRWEVFLGWSLTVTGVFNLIVLLAQTLLAIAMIAML